MSSLSCSYDKNCQLRIVGDRTCSRSAQSTHEVRLLMKLFTPTGVHLPSALMLYRVSLCGGCILCLRWHRGSIRFVHCLFRRALNGQSSRGDVLRWTVYVGKTQGGWLHHGRRRHGGAIGAPACSAFFSLLLNRNLDVVHAAPLSTWFLADACQR